jgi:hypothetical protein
VEVNSHFLKYLEKNTINVEMWSPQGTTTVPLGRGEIALSGILSRAAEDVSAVLRGECQIYSSRKLIATVEYRCRMRLPIASSQGWANAKKGMFRMIESKEVFLSPSPSPKRRTLEICIDGAEGLQGGVSVFVYFTIQNDDFFTEP